MTPVLLGLGANMGDRRASLQSALEGIARLTPLGPVSSLYETAPMYVTDQAPFLNLCARVDTTLDPRSLLAAVKNLERVLGRMPSRRFGPRQIDIDIILYGQRVVAVDDLQIPHPRMLERAFVMIPAREIAADWLHPVAGRSVGDLAGDLGPCNDVVRVGRVDVAAAPV